MRRLQTIWRLLIGKSPRISHVNGCLKSFDGIAPDSSWDHRSQDGQVSLWDVQDEPPSFPPWIPIKRNETLPVPCILQLQVFDGVFLFPFLEVDHISRISAGSMIDTYRYQSSKVGMIPTLRSAISSYHLVFHMHPLIPLQPLHFPVILPLDFSIFPSDIGRDSKRFDPPQATGKEANKGES